MACAFLVASATELFKSRTNQPELYKSANDINTNQPKTNGVFLVCESLKKRMIVVDSPTIAFAKKNLFEIFSSMTVFHRQVCITTKCPQLPTDSGSLFKL